MTQVLTRTSTRSAVNQQIPINASVYIILSALILFAGASLRLYHLANRSLWYDEAVTADISRANFDKMLQLTRTVSAPIVHPFLLYLTERIKSDAWTVRFPSVLGSLGAVLMMLVMPKAKVERWAALFAAAILSLSASQVQYAQEVREYSLAVFVATVLMFCLLHWEAKGMDRHSFILSAALFLAPLIQYGLVLLGVAVLATMVLRALFGRAFHSTIIPILLSASFFICGGLLSFALTLRYQLRVSALGTQAYLAQNYFDPKVGGILHFLWSNTRQLLSFFIPGQLVVVLLIIGGGVFTFSQLRRRQINSITLLFITSFVVTMSAAVFRVYPYGGIRQCLFLAPVLFLFTGCLFADLVSSAERSYQPITAMAVLAIIAISGARGIPRQWPYQELEDNQSLLRELARSCSPTDQVWVNHDAVDAFRFYLPVDDARFTYGKYHADPNDYLRDLRASVSEHTTRLWLAFSHLEQPSDNAEEELMLRKLSQEWTIEKRVSATNAELYLATRGLTQSTTQ